MFVAIGLSVVIGLVRRWRIGYARTERLQLRHHVVDDGIVFLYDIV